MYFKQNNITFHWGCEGGHYTIMIINDSFPFGRRMKNEDGVMVEEDMLKMEEDGVA